MDLRQEIADIDKKLVELRTLVLKYQGAREYLASLLGPVTTTDTGKEHKKPELKVVPHGDNTG